MGQERQQRLLVAGAAPLHLGLGIVGQLAGDAGENRFRPGEAGDAPAGHQQGSIDRVELRGVDLLRPRRHIAADPLSPDADIMSGAHGSIAPHAVRVRPLTDFDVALELCFVSQRDNHLPVIAHTQDLLAGPARSRRAG